VAPTFYMVDIQKAAGDTGEYLKVCFWKPQFYLVDCLHLIYDERCTPYCCSFTRTFV